MLSHSRIIIVATLLVPGVATPSTGQTSGVFIHSEPGDAVGGGFIGMVSGPLWDVHVTAAGPGGHGNKVSVSFRLPPPAWWKTLYPDAVEITFNFDFVGRDLQALKPGTYAPAFHSAWASADREPPSYWGMHAGVAILRAPSGLTFRSCSGVTGRFVIHELEFTTIHPVWSAGHSGGVARFAADLEQHCEGAAPALFAAVRFNSTIDPVPFAGAYPRYELNVTPPSHGRVTGTGISCGRGESTCSTRFSAAGPATLTATPDPGYLFAGWTGGCTGPATITVDVNTTKDCGAIFDPDPPSGPRRLLLLTSEPGDAIGLGMRQVYSAADSPTRPSVWRVAASEDGNHIRVEISAPDGSWVLDLSAPLGERLQPYRVYTGALPAGLRTTSAGLDVYRNGRRCETGSADFFLGSLRMEGTAVQEFSVNFEQSGCNSKREGILNWNSAQVPVRGSFLMKDSWFGAPAEPVKVYVASDLHRTTSIWSASASPDGSAVQVTVDAIGETGGRTWTLNFSAPVGETLRPGTYDNAGPSATSASPGLDVRLNHQNCSSTGYFVIRELQLAGSTVLRFAVDFEQRCSTTFASPLTGILKWNSTQDLTSVCNTPDPFVMLGGGTCLNGGWRPADMTAPAPVSAPALPATWCTGPDPFIAIGGGTCYNGGWLPPGISPAAPSVPPEGGGCMPPDPFASMGGGTCHSGGWLPPGTLPPSAPPPPVAGGCATPDPFTALGGGSCWNGGWLPPGMLPTAPPPAAPGGGCVTPDPFTALGGGSCRNGGWLPPGMY